MTVIAAPLLSTLCRNHRHKACLNCRCICHPGGRMTHPAEARRLAHLHGLPSEHANASHAVDSGAVSGNRKVVLDALREWTRAPHELAGPTAGELAKRTDLSAVEVRRRVSDLKAMGLVWHGEGRTCSEEGTPQHELLTATDATQGTLL